MVRGPWLPPGRRAGATRPGAGGGKGGGPPRRGKGVRVSAISIVAVGGRVGNAPGKGRSGVGKSVRAQKRAAGNPLSAGGSQGPRLLPKAEDTSNVGHVCGACKPFFHLRCRHNP